MKKKRILKLMIILVVTGMVIGGGIALYMFNMPHRDVQSQKADYSLTSTEIVNEYLNDKDAANQKYLAADGESKILEITGTVSKITEDLNGQSVILIKNTGDKAGVRATMQPGSELLISELKTGETITVKGVIRSGANYDEDLEMYENVVLEKSTIINRK
jgi:hypothetical protein